MEVTVSASPQQNELSDTIAIDFPWPNCWGSRRRRGRSLRPSARMLVALVVSAQIFLLGAPAAREIFLQKQTAAAAITGITAGARRAGGETKCFQPLQGVHGPSTC